MISRHNYSGGNISCLVIIQSRRETRTARARNILVTFTDIRPQSSRHNDCVDRVLKASRCISSKGCIVGERPPAHPIANAISTTERKPNTMATIIDHRPEIGTSKICRRRASRPDGTSIRAWPAPSRGIAKARLLILKRNECVHEAVSMPTKSDVMTKRLRAVPGPTFKVQNRGCVCCRGSR